MRDLRLTVLALCLLLLGVSVLLHAPGHTLSWVLGGALGALTQYTWRG